MTVAPSLLQQLSDSTLRLDHTGDWPAEQFRWLAEAGVLGWVIPREFGGVEVSQAELIEGYERLAEACLTTTFILTQRNGACQRIAGCENELIKARLLPALARGESFATVGVSHLTTSRQHLKTPPVRAELRHEEILLAGEIPWVTGAAHAQHVVTGGTCADGRQVLVALPTDARGVSVQPHPELMALTGSHTSSIRLEDVTIPRECLLAGPMEGVMKQGMGGGAGSLVTSTLAVGLCARSLQLIHEQSTRRPDLQEFFEEFSEELGKLREDLKRSVQDGEQGLPQLSAATIRQRANSLALRITQAALAVSKGAGFVKGHPAELAVREAMFFLVWSCPQPVVEGVLQELACRDE